MPEVVLFGQRISLIDVPDTEDYRLPRKRGMRLRGTATIKKTPFNVEAIAVKRDKDGFIYPVDFRCDTILTAMFALSPGEGQLQTVKLEFEGREREYVMFITPLHDDDPRLKEP